MDEYAARKGLTADDRAEFADHEWHFAGRGHVDPHKEANADNIRFGNGSLTMAAYYAKQGKDWKRESAQFIRERIAEEMEWNKAREVAGLPPAPYPRGQQQQSPAAPQEEPEQPEEGEEQ
jgi:capsid protein